MDATSIALKPEHIYLTPVILGTSTDSYQSRKQLVDIKESDKIRFFQYMTDFLNEFNLQYKYTLYSELWYTKYWNVLDTIQNPVLF